MAHPLCFSSFTCCNAISASWKISPWGFGLSANATPILNPMGGRSPCRSFSIALIRVALFEEVFLVVKSRQLVAFCESDDIQVLRQFQCPLYMSTNDFAGRAGQHEKIQCTVFQCMGLNVPAIAHNNNGNVFQKRIVFCLFQYINNFIVKGSYYKDMNWMETLRSISASQIIPSNILLPFIVK